MIDPVTANPTTEEVFLSRLKENTAILHRQLEQSSITSALMRAEIKASDYALYLAAMREVIAWCETSVFPQVNSVILNVDGRRKLNAIDHDLLALRPEIPFQVPPFEKLPDALSLPKALGSMYVLEGSSLGGIVIVKQLQHQPFLTQNTSRFLTVYGKNTGFYWKKFIDDLSRYAIAHNVENEIIEGAQDTFKAIDDYFQSIL